MKLQVFVPHFAPDNAPTGSVMTAIVGGLVELGHEIEIVTSLPWYRETRIEDGWGGKLARIETTPWGQIRRLHPFPTDKANIPARALAFGGFTGLAAAYGAASKFPADIVLAMSPPITLGYAGWCSARRRGVPFVFNIQDVFPDVAIELGVLKGKQAIRFFKAMERNLYGISDAVTVLSDDLADNVRGKIAGGDSGSEPSAEKVRIIPNFVDTDAISATAPGDPANTYRQEFGLTDKTVVMYAGNVGFSQSLELLLDAARTFADRSDVVFVINGNGSARPSLEADASGLRNVRFVDYQPIDRLPEVLAAADVHLVPLKRGLARSSVPSKFYSILAASRPVLASVDIGTELANLIESTNCGIAVEPENSEAFSDALRVLLDDPVRRRTAGEAGRSFVESWISPLGVAEQYSALFDELITNREIGSPATLFTP